MSLNRSVPQLPSDTAISHPMSAEQKPDYAQLVRFLIQPFLESPNSLSVDCEISANTSRVWIRVAFEGEDKGRVFGRGGRNIHNIRTVIAAAATLAGDSVYLDIYGSQAFNNISGGEETDTKSAVPKPREQRNTNPKPTIKPRLQLSSESENLS